MKTLLACLAFIIVLPLSAQTITTVEEQPKPIPFDQFGAEAQKQYAGDGISITPTAGGARLRAIMQRIEGEATAEGLWLSSTAEEDAGLVNRFRVRAVEMGRMGRMSQIAPTGVVQATKDAAVWLRPGLAEEYSVSSEGVRQDFVVAARPAGTGELAVELELAGASAQEAAHGVTLTLDATGRTLAYHRLRVSDATGRELAARLEVPTTDRLRVVVEDAGAVYPVRIDPTFSDADWVSLNPGLPGANLTVRAMAVDGSGNLFIGGDFTVTGTVVASRIAKWNGSAWSALGSGMNGFVNALVVSGSDLYAGGSFTTAGGVAAIRIAKWNGSAWSALGTGMDDTVRALAVSGSDLYAGGSFTTAGGTSANRIAKWNGSVWTALGTGMDSQVNALAVSGSDLYAGGAFTTAGGTSANYIAKWNGSAWSALGTGMDSQVNALAVSGSDLYAGGAFTTAGGTSAGYIAKWNGSVWSALGTGMSSSVNALAVSGSDLYAGGSFTTAGGTSARGTAKWNGSAWSALGTGMINSVNALVVSGSDLYAGGAFTMAGGGTAIRVAKWNGSAWSALGTGMNGTVYALLVSGSDLYAGGEFTMAGGGAAKYIAKWNGSAWSALGTGMDNIVFALVVSGGDLYAGGSFSTAGGGAANRTAKWNGSAWSALGTGMNSDVYALTVSGSDLYAGGNFVEAGSAPANYIAKWNGSAWSALGTGMDNNVYALALSGSDIYAGGLFTTAGGTSANYIAKWNGSAWSPVSTGMNGSVQFLLASGSDLYAGGDFTTAGGVGANRVAKWNGSAWSALGTGVNGIVRALALSGSDLYVGGNLTMAGGASANRIAKWDGSTWSALGTGMNAIVFSLAVDNADHLFVGGNSTLAGTTVSPFIAMGNLISAAPAVPTVTNVAPASGTTSGGTSVTITGTNFTGATGVTFGGTAATSVNVVDATTITAVTPAHAAGAVSVLVTTPGGTNAANTLFTYVTPTTVTSLNCVNPAITNLATVNWTLTFAAANMGVTASNFSLGGAAAAGAVVGTPTTANGGVTWNVPVTTGSTDGSLTLSLANATGMTRGVSTTLPFTSVGQTYTMDKTPPTVTISAPSVSSIGFGGSISYTVTYTDTHYSSSSLNVLAINFITTGDVVVNSYAVSGSGNTRTVLFENISGTGTVAFTIDAATAMDLAGNTAPASAASLPVSVFSSNADLSALTTTASGLAPAFGANILAYTASVPNATTTTTVTATHAEANATLQVQVNGLGFNPLTSGSPSSALALNVGANPIDVRVTAQDGTTIKTYTLTVTRTAPVPTVTLVTPTTGTTSGGTAVTITGTDLTGATGVTFGGSAASFTVDSAMQISATTPAHAAGAVSVLVTTPGGTNAANSLFTYVIPNAAPIITSNGGGAAASINVAENTTTVTTVVATDGDLPAQTITYSKSGTNADLFSIDGSTGALAFITAPDFETNPGPFSVTVTATDNGTPNLSDSQDLTISVTNVNELPGFTKGANQSIPNTGSAQSVSGWATVIDDGDSTVTQSLTFSITGNTNAGLFTTAPAISSTGTLTYTPTGAAGTATLTVTLTDDASINGTAALTTAAQTFTITVLAPDYTVATTGNAVVVTDSAGNGDTLAITEPSVGNIKFAATGRTFSVDGGAGISGDSGTVGLTSVTSITVNAAAGTDTINVSAFTSTLPDLTINGGTGNDTVNLNGDITFASNTSLDLDLQNDNLNPGTDIVNVAENANLLASGTGAITVKVSRNLDMFSGSSFETVNGGITLEANQQAVSTAGSFAGISLLNAIVRSTGTGVVSLVGKGGNSGNLQHGVRVWQGGLVSGGTTGTTTVTGFGGSSTGTDNYGVNVLSTNTAITSAGSHVSVTGTGGGAGSSSNNFGVIVFSDGKITAGGSGTVSVTGQGGNPSGTGGSNQGVFVSGPSSTITSNGGNISLTGTGGGGSGSSGNRGVLIQLSSTVAGTSSATVTLIGTGGGGTGNSHGVRLISTGAVTAVNGSISISGSVADGTTASQGFTLSSSASVGAKVQTTGSGTITVAADSMNISTSGVALDAGTNSVTLSQKTNSRLINLGSGVDTTANTLELADGELDVITAGTLVIGDSNSGAITISAAISPANYQTLDLQQGVNFSAAGGFTSDVTSATVFEKIKANGAVVIDTSAALTVAATGGFVPAASDSFTIVDNTSASTTTGSFTGKPEATLVAVGGVNKTLTYVGGTGNDVVLTGNLAPAITSNGGGAAASIDVAENTTAVTTVNANDADTPAQTLTYTKGGPDAALFSIDSSSGVLAFITAPDFETNPGPFSVTVTAMDNGTPNISDSQDLTISVTNVNELPSFTKGANQSIANSTTTQTVTGWATVIDDGDSTVTQALTFNVSHDNNALFTTQPTIAANGTLTYTPAGLAGSALVSVSLTDDASLSGPALTTAVQTFTITVAAPAPTVTRVTPATGTTAGGTNVTITGTHFTGATAVTFGGTNATSFTVDSATQITATTPAHAAGAVSVLVTTPGGTNAANTAFTYLSNNADLAALILSRGALTPGFSAGTTTYTASVSHAVDSVTVRPFTADAGATLSVNGTPLVSGTVSSSLPLSVGPNVITTLVTAEDNATTRSYEITVTRAAAPVGGGQGPAFEEFIDPNPSPGNLFGHSVVALSTGNVVITSPYDDAGGTDAGAAYLFNGATGALISTVTGSMANDKVGIDGVVALATGNYLIRTTYWHEIGESLDPGLGAVTFGNGVTGVSGVVSAANSLVGTQTGDNVGHGGVIALSNGNYVVCSDFWDDGTIVSAGAATFGNGTTGIVGPVTTANSLHGTGQIDAVGESGAIALSNGNYVVVSYDWGGGPTLGVGAVTLVDGLTGMSGPVTAANSLVGSTPGDRVGLRANDGTTQGVTALSNGNFVVNSGAWHHEGTVNAGAVTFVNGTTGLTGPVTTANSLHGTSTDDSVNRTVIALTNGSYVVNSYNWDNGGTVNVGAVTFGNGSTGVTGPISTANSLHGSTAFDLVGGRGVVALSNGNYVVASRQWDHGAIENVGAATWGSGTIGIVGPVTTANSLHGSILNDLVGNDVVALANGNYVVEHESWNNGVPNARIGAVTWADGSTGLTGPVTTANSLYGSTANDFSFCDTKALTNGNYVVRIQNWDNAGIANAGAVVFGNGSTGIVGPVTTANSLHGTVASGLNGVIVPLTQGNYLVSYVSSDIGSIVDAGTVTFGNGTTGITGTATAANSLHGRSNFDGFGLGVSSAAIKALSNGNYVIPSRVYSDSGLSAVGAFTFGNGTTGSFGPATASNSLFGKQANTGDGLREVVEDSVNGTFYARFLFEDNGKVRVGSTETGFAPPATPEITITGSGLEITSGDPSPGSADGTDFGSTALSGGTVTRLFTVTNTGTAPLNLTGSPVVQISGAHASDFTATATPGTPIAPLDFATFEIEFDPSDTGTRTALITVESDDPLLPSYTFAIRGSTTPTGTDPIVSEVALAGGTGTTGTQVPGAPVGTTYHTFFGSPAIGTAATFAVRGQIKRPDNHIQHGLFLGTGPELFLRGQDTLFAPGDAAPASLPGAAFQNFLDPVLNADNRITFIANVIGAGYTNSNRRAVFTNIPDGTLRVIAQQNSTFGGITYGTPSTISVAGDSVLIQDAQRLYTWDLGHGTRLIFENGQSVGSRTVQAFEFTTNTGYASAQGRSHVLDSSGSQKIALSVSFTDGSKGIVTGRIAPDGTLSGFDTPLVASGQPVDSLNPGPPVLPGVTYSTSLFQKPGWDQSGRWFGYQAFLQSGSHPGGTVSTYNNAALFIEVAPGETLLQVREGEQAAGAPAGVSYKDFYELSLGDSPAQYAFYADLRGPGVTSANMTGLWYKDSSGIRLAARTGSPAPGIPGGIYKSINLFGQPSQARLGFTAALNLDSSITAANDLGFWAINSLGEVKLALREGQTYSTSTGDKTIGLIQILNAGLGASGAARGFTPDGRFTALITFTDASQVIVEIEVP